MYRLWSSKDAPCTFPWGIRQCFPSQRIPFLLVARDNFLDLCGIAPKKIAAFIQKGSFSACDTHGHSLDDSMAADKKYFWIIEDKRLILNL